MDALVILAVQVIDKGGEPATADHVREQEQKTSLVRVFFREPVHTIGADDIVKHFVLVWHRVIV